MRAPCDLHSLRYRETGVEGRYPPYTRGYTPSREAGHRAPEGQLSAWLSRAGPVCASSVPVVQLPLVFCGWWLCEGLKTPFPQAQRRVGGGKPGNVCGEAQSLPLPRQLFPSQPFSAAPLLCRSRSPRPSFPLVLNRTEQNRRGPPLPCTPLSSPGPLPAQRRRPTPPLISRPPLPVLPSPGLRESTDSQHLGLETGLS